MLRILLSSCLSVLAISALVTALGTSGGLPHEATSSYQLATLAEASRQYFEAGHQGAASLFPATGPSSEQPPVAEQMLVSTEASAPLSHADIVKQTTTESGHKIELVSGGAKITCQLQTLEGHLTPTGLSIRSVDQAEPGAFAVRTAAWGRDDNVITIGPGHVVVDASVARLVHVGGLTEEVTTSSDGIRQDWVIESRPIGSGPLNLDVALDGATVTAHTDNRVDLTVAGGREIVWHQLLVTDAIGTELAARFSQRSDNDLRVSIDDQHAVYPIRVDPTFTDANWLSIGGVPGTNGSVYAMAPYASGIVVGGDFAIAGTAVANRVAYWNGSAWSGLGSGMNDIVLALTVSGSDVYAGGAFTTAGGVTANKIAKWNGSAWSPVGSGMNSTVRALAISGSEVYAGGFFTKADGLDAYYIAKWSGSAWSAVGSGMNDPVYALAVMGSDVYAGGDFTTADGNAANRVAVWNGNSWLALGQGINTHTVWALAVSGEYVYAGGQFTTAGLITAENIAVWNGSAWFPVGLGRSYTVSSLAVLGTDIYAAGSGAGYIAKWNGSTWSSFGAGTNPSINTLAVSGTDVYAGGSFHLAGDSAANNVAKWSGIAWSALGSGTNNNVYALAVSGTNVYAGGAFTTLGGVAANYIAKWNGSTWSALGLGMDNFVFSLAVSGTDVYAGGDFSMAGDGAASHIAKWDGNTWSALDSGTDSSVFALSILGANVYAGGNFTSVGDIHTSSIAMWNGSEWSALGTGVNNYVYALAVSGSDIYAGGSFTNAGGVTGTNKIAKWNGTVWSALESGITGTVLALAVSGTDVYAGGDFSTAGGDAAYNIAKWNGSMWSAVGSGVNSAVLALAVSGTDVYAGGNFTTTIGGVANKIAKWNGSAWSPLGSGLNDSVRALAVLGTDVYAGGVFTTAGGKVSAYIAVAATSNDEVIYYDANGATGGTVPASQTKIDDVNLTLATNTGGLMKTGYTFAGWNTAANGSGTAYAAGATYSANMGTTLFAQWTMNATYVVMYNGNGNTGGTVPAAQSKTHDIDLTLAINSGALVKTGSSFAGWNTAADGSGSAYAVGATYGTNAPTTFYAQWTLNTYVVTYDNNGSTTGTVPANQTKIYGISLALAVNSGALAQTGSTFVGWNTMADGSGTVYAVGATYIANEVAILYAQWTTLSTFIVTYDGNGSTSGTVPADQVKIEDTDLILASNNDSLAKTDFTFAGWNTAANGSGTTYAAGAPFRVNADTTLYAKWSAIGSGGGNNGGSSSGSGGGCGAGSGLASALGLLLLVCGIRFNGFGLRNRE